MEILEQRRMLVGDSVVVFNEIMYNPPGNQESLEWVELYNQNAVNIDLSGWRLTGGVRYEFSEGTVIPGRGYLVIARDPAALQQATGFAGSSGPFVGQLSNGGEELRLLDKNQRIMNTVAYDDRGDWPVAADGSGATLAKVRQDTNSELAANWNTSSSVGGTPGTRNFSVDDQPLAGPIVINEVASATADTFWLEFANLTSSSVDLTGLVLVADESGSSYSFPRQTLPAGEYAAVSQDQLGFDARAEEILFLYGPDQKQLLDATRVKDRMRGRSPEHDGQWLFPDAATPGGANHFTFQGDIVINEIMFHHEPRLATSDVAFSEDPEEWIELLNRGEGPVDLSGWSLRDGVDFDFPLGTVLGAGDYLVVSNYVGALVEKYPDINVVGNFDRSLSDRDDNVLLRDAFGNPADEVHYYDSGRWGDYADGGGSSLELRDPHADNSKAEAWAASDEGRDSAWHTYTSNRVAVPFQGEFRSPIGGAVPPVQFNDFVFGFLDSGEVLLDDIHVRMKDDARVEQLVSVDSGWRYNASGAPLDVNWARTIFAADDPGWAEGPGLIGFDNDRNALPETLRTELDDPQSLDPFVRTYYFQTDFNLDGDANDFDDLQLRPVVDDGAVFYLNGVEVLRVGMPAGPIGPDTLSVTDVDNADYQGPMTIPKIVLRPGLNTLSVEVHQSGTDSDDVVFGAELLTSTQTGGSELIQNSDFEGDEIGGQPFRWRIGGNHNGQVVRDPHDPANKALRLRGSGSLGYVSNSAETTLANNQSIVVGAEYEVSFRAKWIGGSRQLNNRAWYSHLAETTVLRGDSLHGTPGERNSRFEPDIGPTFSDLQHQPVIPEVDEPVTVSVLAKDPHGVASATLWWSTGEAFSGLPMSAAEDGRFTATLPGQSGRTITQFYVEAEDGHGVTSTFPPAGADSGAMFEVNDGAAEIAEATGADSLRLILTGEATRLLHSSTNLMSDGFLPATLVVNERELFYDVGVRLRGSEHSRDASTRVGFVVGLQPDQLFRGVHQRFSIDRSTRASGTPPGPAEIIIRQFMNHAGNIPSEYGDIIHVIAPRATHNSPAHLRLAQFGEVYLDTQFDNGGNNPLFELEMIFTPPGFVRGDPNNPKLHTGGPFYDFDIEDIGDDKELYRFHLDIKNNRDEDDYSRIIQMNQVMSMPAGPEFDAAISDVIDVDQWMRVMATKSLTMDFDGYGSVNYRHNQNVMFYVRPSDDRIIAMPWDIDGSFNFDFVSTRASIYPRQGITTLTKLIERPVSFRLFLGHLHDMIMTTWNPGYMEPWMQHFGEKAGQNLLRNLTAVQRRGDYVLEQLPPETPFSTITQSPLDVGASATAIIEGFAWVNVRELRLAGSDRPLDVTWKQVGPSQFANGWEVAVPVDSSTQDVTLEAYDFQGNLLDSASVAVVSSASNPLVDALRMVELNYNPHAPTGVELNVDPNLDNDDFEFIELRNVADDTIQLLNTHFTDGIDYTFPFVELAPGQPAVIVRDLDAFRLRYGPDVPVIGEFAAGRLDNAGERVTLVTAGGTPILDFAYGDDDPWPERADGVGGTLQLIAPAETPADQFGKHDRWRGSTRFGGSPGGVDADPIGVVINEVLSNSNSIRTSDSIELHNLTDVAINAGGWYLSDSADDLLKFRIADETVIGPHGYVVFDESHFNSAPQNPRPGDFALSGTRGDDVWLVIADQAGQPVTFVDDVSFGPAADGESFGRAPDGVGRLAPMATRTLGSQNSSPRVGPAVISEINYHPGPPSAAALAIDANLRRDELEFVEVHNPTARVIRLTDWRVRGTIDFDFHPGDQLEAGQSVVLTSFNPLDPENASRAAAFRAHYGLDDRVRLVGGYQGALNDDGGRVRLERPDASPAEEPDLIPRLVEDSVLYDDVAPWPTLADGTGRTLTRTAATAFGGRPEHWVAATPTPGTTDFVSADFNDDGRIDAADIDLLAAGIRAGNQQFDLTGDRRVDQFDLTVMVQTIMETSFGDSNLDGIFDSSDLVQVFRVGQYEDGVAGNSGWAAGDWDGDGDFGTGDLVLAFRSGGFRAAALPRRQVDAALAAAELTDRGRAVVPPPRLGRPPVLAHKPRRRPLELDLLFAQQDMDQVRNRTEDSQSLQIKLVDILQRPLRDDFRQAVDILLARREEV